MAPSIKSAKFRSSPRALPSISKLQSTSSLNFALLQLELQEMVISASQEQNKDKDSKSSEPQISRLQLEFWCKEKKSVLVVSILAADNLPLRDDYYFGGCQPEAFIRLRLIPSA